jgi:hypothetical protein
MLTNPMQRSGDTIPIGATAESNGATGVEIAKGSTSLEAWLYQGEFDPILGPKPSWLLQGNIYQAYRRLVVETHYGKSFCEVGDLIVKLPNGDLEVYKKKYNN